MLECCKNWKHIFEEFVLICSKFSSNTTVQGLTWAHEQLQRFTALYLPPYRTDLAPSDFHLLPKLKEHLRWHNLSDGVETVVKMWFRHKETELYHEGLMKLPECWCVVTWSTEVIMLRSNCVKLQNKVQVFFFVSMKHLFPLWKKGGFTFWHAYVVL
jgi:hypothetical protein